MVPTRRPGPLEAYAANFDPVLRRLPQPHGFRDHPIGLLTPTRARQDPNRTGRPRTS